MKERILIVNADDFGRSAGVNEGITKAHREGIVTSSSLMVRWPEAAAAGTYARESDLAVGLHLDLGEWAYLDGSWQALYSVVDTEDPDAVAAEADRQLARFQRLVGRAPTHLDSHQHVHRDEPARSVLLDIGRQLGVPVRHFDPGIRYSGDFYGQDGRGESLPDSIAVAALTGLIEGLPEGLTELCCHPAVVDDHRTMYRSERLQELATLCDPEIRRVLDREGVLLRSFAEVAAAA